MRSRSTRGGGRRVLPLTRLMRPPLFVAERRGLAKRCHLMLIQRIAIFLLGLLILLPFPGSLRTRAWLKIITATFAEIAVLMGINIYGINPENRLVLWLIAYPLVYAAVGAMELSTGKSFLRLADQWNGFTPRRREQITFFVIVVAFGFIAIACALYTRISITPRRWK